MIWIKSFITVYVILYHDIDIYLKIQSIYLETLIIDKITKQECEFLVNPANEVPDESLNHLGATII